MICAIQIRVLLTYLLTYLLTWAVMYVVGVASVHVEFEETSNDDLVVAEFVAVLENSSSADRERILDAVQQTVDKLRQRDVELIAVKPTGSVVAFFVLKVTQTVPSVRLCYDISLCPVSTIPLRFFRCRFAVPVSRCRFRTPLPLPLPLPLRIFLLFTAVTERNFLT